MLVGVLSHFVVRKPIYSGCFVVTFGSMNGANGYKCSSINNENKSLNFMPKFANLGIRLAPKQPLVQKSTKQRRSDGRTGTRKVAVKSPKIHFQKLASNTKPSEKHLSEHTVSKTAAQPTLSLNSAGLDQWLSQVMELPSPAEAYTKSKKEQVVEQQKSTTADVNVHETIKQAEEPVASSVNEPVIFSLNTPPSLSETPPSSQVQTPLDEKVPDHHGETISPVREEKDVNDIQHENANETDAIHAHFEDTATVLHGASTAPFVPSKEEKNQFSIDPPVHVASSEPPSRQSVSHVHFAAEEGVHTYTKDTPETHGSAKGMIKAQLLEAAQKQDVEAFQLALGSYEMANLNQLHQLRTDLIQSNALKGEIFLTFQQRASEYISDTLSEQIARALVDEVKEQPTSINAQLEEGQHLLQQCQEDTTYLTQKIKQSLKYFNKTKLEGLLAPAPPSKKPGPDVTTHLREDIREKLDIIGFLELEGALKASS